MIRSTVCCLVIGFLFTAALPAQFTGWPSYQRATERLVLLHNAQNTLPLGGLDTLRLRAVTIGMETDTSFFQTLGRYLPVEPVRLTEAWNYVDYARQAPEAVDVVIVGINAERAPITTLLDVQQYFSSAQQPPRIVAVIFGQSVLWSYVRPDYADAIIYAERSDYWEQSLAAQLIFGGTTTTRRLRQPLSGAFRQHDGLDATPATRLGYAPPEAVGMRSHLLRDSIQQIISSGIAAGAFPGAQVLVARQGKVVYHEAFGHPTYDTDRQLDTDAIYDLASVTKVSAATPALMKLYSDNQLSLDQPMGQYVPTMQRGNKRDITYRQVLAHQSRLRAWIPFWRATLRGNARYPWKKSWDNNRLNDYNFRRRTFAQDSSADYNVRVTDGLWLHHTYREQMLKSIRKSPLNKTSGYVYSDLSFLFTPDVVRDRAGMAYTDYLQRNFYGPLGATTLGYNPLQRFVRDRIVPTERDTFFRMVQLHGTVHDEGAAMLGGVSGHAGLFGNANDLAKLWQMYLNGGTYGGERYLPSEVLDEFTRCQYCPEDNRRGLGFDRPLIQYEAGKSHVAQAASDVSFGHSGYTGTFVWADPQSELLYIFLSNRVYPTRDNPLISRLDIRPRIHAALYQAITDVAQQ